ncbi:PD-(D/E)XK nuclease family protein [Sphingomonas sp. LY160]|uniref:PD-(D/E)XK nuclease family protein n=1 Tax=Sphingomonas sp. LY160 TaxID=3095342 RepID=UPI002ADED280|nr:PD-(D/E)XK nuclease family protein [Sphingomonas sp. LY160]MEA1071726.1 PD-(D/E)XK nuclease family protein [Sphingomonas sp. LY160]
MSQTKIGHAVTTAAVDDHNFDSVAATFQLVQALGRSHAQARAMVTSDHAPQFNVLDFFGHREVLLSRVIAWMLDPNGTHGEGTAFLQHFLKMFTPKGLHQRLNEDRLRSAVITREAETSGPTPAECGRYIDVLIELPGGETVAIENKLTQTAPWMEEQLRCYRAHIARRAGPESHWVVALIGWGTDAQAEVAQHWGAGLPDDGSVQGYGRGHVADWAAKCASISRAQAVKVFLQNFEQFMDRPRSEGAGSMRQTAELADLLTRDGDSFASALAIAEALPLAKESLVRVLNEQFRQNVEKRGWEVPLGSRDRMLTVHEGETGLHIRFQHDLPWVFSLTFFKDNLNDPYWGIRASEIVDHSNDTDLKSKFDKALWNGRGPDQHWIWWSKKGAPLSNIWASVQDGNLVQHVIERASVLSQKIPGLLASRSAL